MKSGPEMTVIPKSGDLEKKITKHKCFNIFYKYYSAKTHVIDPKGAFHLRKKPGNFGGSKSGISDW